MAWRGWAWMRARTRGRGGPRWWIGCGRCGREMARGVSCRQLATPTRIWVDAAPSRRLVGHSLRSGHGEKCAYVEGGVTIDRGLEANEDAFV